MQIISTGIPGCYEIKPSIHEDRRGRFVKTFIREEFEKNKLRTDFEEEYYSCSVKGVIRGLHFQLPPEETAKLVYCVSGEVLDAIVDLRVGSPTYNCNLTFDLTEVNAKILYLPAGIAHGFQAVSEKAILMYKVTARYSPAHDSGILWNSAGVPWIAENPIISDRDMALPSLQNFQSPFFYK